MILSLASPVLRPASSDHLYYNNCLVRQRCQVICNPCTEGLIGLFMTDSNIKLTDRTLRLGKSMLCGNEADMNFRTSDKGDHENAPAFRPHGHRNSITLGSHVSGQWTILLDESEDAKRNLSCSLKIAHRSCQHLI